MSINLSSCSVPVTLDGIPTDFYVLDKSVAMGSVMLSLQTYTFYLWAESTFNVNANFSQILLCFSADTVIVVEMGLPKFFMQVLYSISGGKDPILAAVGQLQFEVRYTKNNWFLRCQQLDFEYNYQRTGF
jgi:hypothetical protein